MRLAAALLCIALVPAHAGAAEVRVAVAANFHGTLQRLAPLFKAASGHTLTISAGASGALYTQIVQGAPFDVLLSADVERPERLERAGHAVPGTRFVYAHGVLVMWSARPDFIDPEGKVLESDAIRHVAVADPRFAPYGVAAEQVLRARGVLARLDAAGRLVRGQSIGQTYGHVASGAAELGFVALAQLVRDEAIPGSYWMPPRSLYAPIAQAAVLLARARDADAAKDFLEWLRGADARAVIERAGYRVD